MYVSVSIMNSTKLAIELIETNTASAANLQELDDDTNKVLVCVGSLIIKRNCVWSCAELVRKGA